MIQLRNVQKWFGDHQVLRDTQLSVASGEVVVICGPSGSGKSTLIRTINQLEPITAGELQVGEFVIRAGTPPLADLRSKVGFVFQQFNLYPHLTVLDNITLAPRKLRGLSKTQAEQEALALLERVQLQDKRHQYPGQLSGGQQQRVAIARALAMQPQILLFDEPTSALDPEMIGEVLLVIKELAHSGITMIIVTHELAFAREVADRIVFIDQGQILEQAEPEVFFRAPGHPRTRQFLGQILNPLHSKEWSPIPESPSIIPVFETENLHAGEQKSGHVHALAEAE